jgi:glycerol-3-phosphate dehydrogenase
MAAHGDKIPRRAGVLVLSKGLVPPLGTLPSAFVAERCAARAVAALGGPADAADTLEHGASVVLASIDRAFSRQLSDTLTTAGFEVSTTPDVTGVELAGAAKNVAVLAAAVASIAGPNVAGAAAGKVFAEVDALARAHGGRPETFAGLAGAGDLVASAVSPNERNRKAGELLAQGVPAAEIDNALGHAVEAVDAAPLLASAARSARLDTPALDSLTALIEGRIEPEQWTATVTDPPRPTRKSSIRAA